MFQKGEKAETKVDVHKLSDEANVQVFHSAGGDSEYLLWWFGNCKDILPGTRTPQAALTVRYNCVFSNSNSIQKILKHKAAFECGGGQNRYEEMVGSY